MAQTSVTKGLVLIVIGAVLGAVVGVMWERTAGRSELESVMAESVGKVQAMAAARHELADRTGEELQKQYASVSEQYPLVAQYISAEEATRLSLLGTLAYTYSACPVRVRISPLCERQWVLTDFGYITRQLVCPEDEICEPDLVPCYEGLARCSEDPRTCTALFELCLRAARSTCVSGLPFP